METDGGYRRRSALGRCRSEDLCVGLTQIRGDLTSPSSSCRISSKRRISMHRISSKRKTLTNWRQRRARMAKSDLKGVGLSLGLGLSLSLVVFDSGRWWVEFEGVDGWRW
ncbi:hypothetical protein Dsin_027277 [Dipteronia sinensis]|uniref:Uncharacterized protein n=1 Tax=Dipteronia sinensis TaxID=43782 RepID=A0AAD9ZQ34_9ROSI|nr:hypothetical protein Dsin_027277 [Dipteronia sinensis]